MSTPRFETSRGFPAPANGAEAACRCGDKYLQAYIMALVMTRVRRYSINNNNGGGSTEVDAYLYTDNARH